MSLCLDSSNTTLPAVDFSGSILNFRFIDIVIITSYNLTRGDEHVYDDQPEHPNRCGNKKEGRRAIQRHRLHDVGRSQCFSEAGDRPQRHAIPGRPGGPVLQ